MHHNCKKLGTIQKYCYRKKKKMVAHILNVEVGEKRRGEKKGRGKKKRKKEEKRKEL